MTASIMPQIHNKDLISLLNNLSDTSVLVVGDVILDKFIYGSVDRISPESPVPVLALSREDIMLGGAGNAFANLVGLGVKAQLLAVIGDDDDGGRIAEHMAGMGQSADHLIVDSSRPTSVKTRFLAGHQQLLRSDFEVTGALSADVADDLVQRFSALLSGVQAVILSDYGKGVLSPSVLKRLIEAARAQDIPVIVDPKGQDFGIYRGASAVTPNRKELADATQGMAVDSDADIQSAAERILTECGVGAVIATRSQDGMSVIQAGAAPYHVESAQDIEVFDVSGAGDTVIATIAASVAAGGSLEQAAVLANMAGSIAVTKVGTAAIRLADLVDAVDNGLNAASSPARARMAPLADDHSALEHVKRWKAKGLRVGFTNGCFDIVHAGHVTYLDEARGRCDRLIMALNSDASVKILKGPERPIHDEVARATVIGALASVDMVVLFGAEQAGDDNTASRLLDFLKPDLYFKGGDYKVEDIPETPTVEAYGGTVEVLSVVDGYSTTNAISKIRASDAA